MISSIDAEVSMTNRLTIAQSKINMFNGTYFILEENKLTATGSIFVLLLQTVQRPLF